MLFVTILLAVVAGGACAAFIGAHFASAVAGTVIGGRFCADIIIFIAALSTVTRIAVIGAWRGGGGAGIVFFIAALYAITENAVIGGAGSLTCGAFATIGRTGFHTITIITVIAFVGLAGVAFAGFFVTDR